MLFIPLLLIDSLSEFYWSWQGYAGLFFETTMFRGAFGGILIMTGIPLFLLIRATSFEGRRQTPVHEEKIRMNSCPDCGVVLTPKEARDAQRFSGTLKC